MRLNRLFWPLMLVLIGTVLLLQNMNVIKIGWSFIWPSVMILFGVWVLIGSVTRGTSSRSLTIPLEGAEKAQIEIHYGAGRLNIGSGSEAGSLLSGTFDGGVDERVSREGAVLRARLDAMTPPFMAWSERREWQLGLSTAVAMGLRIEAGAMESTIDLTNTRVTEFDLQTGASDVRVTMPARAGLTHANIEGGATSIKMRIPEGVAARIRVDGAVHSVEVDTKRFPKSGNIYLSPDFEKAEHKADIRVELGAGSIRID